MDLPCGTRNTSYGHEMAIIRTRWQWGLFLALLIFMVLFPLFADRGVTRIISILAIDIIAIQGLNITMGYCGQISLAQAAFMAVGACSSAIFVTKCSFPFWLALPLAGLVTAIIGMAFGAPSLRIKGLYLALATLAAHFIIMYAIVNLPGLTGGNEGIAAPRPEWGGSRIPDQYYYYMTLSLAFLFTLFTKNLARTRMGRAFIAIRDNDIAAELMGINLFYYKLLAFFIGCFYAGIAGSLLVHLFTYFLPEQFPLINSVWLLGMLIIGGLGSVSGVIFGAIFITALKKMVFYGGPLIEGALPVLGMGASSSLADILFAFVLIVFLIWEPRGLAHLWGRFKSAYRLWPYSY